MPDAPGRKKVAAVGAASIALLESKPGNRAGNQLASCRLSRADQKVRGGRSADGPPPESEPASSSFMLFARSRSCSRNSRPDLGAVSRATPAPTTIPRENRPKQGSIHSAALRFVRRPTKRNKTSLSSSLKSLSFMVPPVQVVQPLLRTGALLLAALLLAAIESTQRSLRDAHQLVLDQWNRGQADAQSQQA